MKSKIRITRSPEAKSEPMELRETMALPGVGLSIPVRAAKAKLSALLELVAGGQQVTITSDGVPKAVLSPVAKHEQRKVFTGTAEHLKKMPPWRGGPTAEKPSAKTATGGVGSSCISTPASS